MTNYLKLLPFFLALFLGMILKAQGQNRDYFPHKIILKYKSDAQLQSIKSKTKIDPKNQVQQTLQKVGAINIKPIFSLQNHPALHAKRTAQFKRSAENLSRIYEVTYSSQADAKILATYLSKMPGVAYAEPKYIRRMQFTPDDPIENPYQSYHRFDEAWAVTHGSPDVVIAIVDGGVNYQHRDLDDKLWVNTTEVNAAVRGQVDQHSDGTITSTEVLQYLNDQNGDYNNDGSITLTDALASGSSLLSGSDTDGNGYIDDIFGWDFWQSGGFNGQAVTEDNDPDADGTDHGTHVAGIAAAETNNGQGVAGTGFNARYMAVKAGGIPDDPTTEDDESDIIGFGFEGIIYAAMEGADVINCSWGGGGFSNFENDVINFAVSSGALVVAAAGNEALEAVDFPSGYEKTLSVGSIETSDQISSYSNIGYDLDVLVTGSGIKSTSFNNDIVTKSGTSMATPVAAGLAALVKAVHPDWTPLHVDAQLRSSSKFLSNRRPRDGHGKLDAYRAVTTNLPGVRVKMSDFNDSNGGKLGLGENGTIELKIINYGSQTTNLNLQIEPVTAQGITLSQPSKNIGTMASGDSINVSFPISISENYDLIIIPTFQLNFTDNNQNYSDFDILQYGDILYDVMDVNNIKMSLAGDGTIGFTNALSSSGGVGFIPQDDDSQQGNLLFEGGLMLEANGEIFDAVRGPDDGLNKDFDPIETFSVEKNGDISAQDGHTSFTFRDETSGISGKIQLDTYAFTDASLRNVVYLKYSITNTSNLPLNDIYAGLFNDWDIGNDVSLNSIEYSEPDSILYVFDDTESSETPIVAVAHLSPISSILAINNFPDTPPNKPNIDLEDGFQDSEKHQALTAGKSQTEVTTADISAVTASGPYMLNPHSTLTLGFVYAFGVDLDELRAQIAAAREQIPFDVSPTGVVISDVIPENTDLLQNFPNPFSDQTTIRLNLSKAADVKLTIFDVLGQKVRVLRDGRMEANEYFIPFNPVSLSSGIYYLRLQTDEKVKTIPITYIK